MGSGTARGGGWWWRSSVATHTRPAARNKTVLLSAAQHDPARVRIVPIFLVPQGDDAPGLEELARACGSSRSWSPIGGPGTSRSSPRWTASSSGTAAAFSTLTISRRCAGLFLGRRRGLGLVATAHGWSRLLSRPAAPVPRRRPLGRCAATDGDRVSEATPRSCAASRAEERLEIVPNASTPAGGVRLPRRPPRPRASRRDGGSWARWGGSRSTRTWTPSSAPSPAWRRLPRPRPSFSWATGRKGRGCAPRGGGRGQGARAVPRHRTDLRELYARWTSSC